jgi:D-lactate dehydrogenase
LLNTPNKKYNIHMPPIVFLEVDKEDESRVKEQFSDALMIHENSTEEGVLDQCKDAEILSCFIYSKLQKEQLDKLPKLKLIATRSVGFNHIDLEECAKRKIVVCNVPDYGSHVIAEHVYALLLGTLRHIHEGDERVEKGNFDYRGLRGITLRGKTIGVVGTGKIGAHVCRVAHGFGMKVLAVDRCRTLELEELFGVKYVEMEELIKGADIISLHLPLLDATKHIIDKEEFDQMKDGVILINTARGGLVNTDALVEALGSGKVAYALLDVLENEKDYEENKELIEHPNAITTPHIAFYSDESMKNMYDDCFESIEQFTAGKEPGHVVKPPKVVCDLPELKKSH